MYTYNTINTIQRSCKFRDLSFTMMLILVLFVYFEFRFVFTAARCINQSMSVSQIVTIILDKKKLK